MEINGIIHGNKNLFTAKMRVIYVSIVFNG